MRAGGGVFAAGLRVGAGPERQPNADARHVHRAVTWERGHAEFFSDDPNLSGPLLGGGLLGFIWQATLSPMSFDAGVHHGINGA